MTLFWGRCLVGAGLAAMTGLAPAQQARLDPLAPLPEGSSRSAVAQPAPPRATTPPLPPRIAPATLRDRIAAVGRAFNGRV